MITHDKDPNTCGTCGCAIGHLPDIFAEWSYGQLEDALYFNGVDVDCFYDRAADPDYEVDLDDILSKFFGISLADVNSTFFGEPMIGVDDDDSYGLTTYDCRLDRVTKEMVA